MADDPREALGRLRAKLTSVCDSGRIDRLPADLVAEFEAAVRVDSVDPLRALLADEDRAVKRLRFAVADPGSFLARGDNYAEPITSWSARAVLAALREVAGNG